jgi:hypothetical protein
VIDLERERRLRDLEGEARALMDGNPRLRQRVEHYLRTEEDMTASKMAAFRLEPELLDGLERAADILTKHGGGYGPKWNKVDVLRYFIKRGLEELKIEVAAPVGPKDKPSKAPAKARAPKEAPSPRLPVKRYPVK